MADIKQFTPPPLQLTRDEYRILLLCLETCVHGSYLAPAPAMLLAKANRNLQLALRDQELLPLGVVIPGEEPIPQPGADNV